eukprot:gene10261-12137_t
MRKWHNARGEGKVFSFDVVDEHQGEIRLTCFNQVAEKFEPMVQVGGVYVISKGSLKPKRKEFNNTNSDYEISLELSSVVEECSEEVDIPRVIYQFSKVRDLQEMDFGSVMDICGIPETIGEAAVIMRRDGTETQKRTMTVVDDSGCSVEVTAWGTIGAETIPQLEQMFQQGLRPVVAFKGLRLGNFGGRSLSTISSSQINIDPEVPEAAAVRNWYAQGGAQNKTSLTTAYGGRADKKCTFGMLKDEQSSGSLPGTLFLQVTGTISFIRSDSGVMYPACPRMNGERACNKKMRQEGQDEKWYCEKCQSESPTVDWRYIFSILAMDHTSACWLSLFNEAGESIFGMTANQLKDLQDNNTLEYERVVSAANFKTFHFKVRVAEDTYNDE